MITLGLVLVRAALTAALVVTASVAAEALGPFWGALMVSVPVTTGPAYTFLFFQHGAGFVAETALAGFVSNAATGVFLTVYTLLARYGRAWPAFGAAVVSWVAAACALQVMPWSPLGALLLNLAVYGAGAMLVRSTIAGAMAPAPRAVRRWASLAGRAVLVAAFVTVIVGVSSMLGPAGTGVVAAFPITVASVTAILGARQGALAGAALAGSALMPMLGFGFMLLGLHLAIPLWGIGPAVLLAFAISAGWSVGLAGIRRR